MTVADPYPNDLFEEPEVTESIDAGQRELIRVLTRIAVALERQPVQNGPGRPQLAPLPPIATQTLDGCPIHNAPWKTVPAGVSKKTGKPYEAFQACSIAGCDQRPRR